MQNLISKSLQMFSKELVNLITAYFKAYNLDISEEDAQLKLHALGNLYASAKEMLEEYYALDKIRKSDTMQK